MVLNEDRLGCYGHGVTDRLNTTNYKSPVFISVYWCPLVVERDYPWFRGAAGISRDLTLLSWHSYGMPKLTIKQIKEALPGIPDWKRNGDVISRTYEFKGFPAAIGFVRAVAKVAEQAWHHPDIDIRWNKVTLRLTTHDEGGLTRKDFLLARDFDRLVK